MIPMQLNLNPGEPIPTLVYLDVDGEYLALTFHYNATLIALIKSLPSRVRSWDGARWKVHKSQAEKIMTILANYKVGYSPSFDKHVKTVIEEANKKKLEYMALVEKLQLFDFQKQGIEKGLCKENGFIFASEPGTGKTLMALVLAKARGKNTLIIVPCSLMEQWKNEIGNWLQEDAVIIRGTPKQREALICRSSFFKITSYEAFRKDYAKYSLGEKTIICDEASKLKNSTAKITQLMYELPLSSFKIALTGTPIENSLNNYWSIFNVVNPWEFPYWEFKDRHLIMETQTKGGNTFSTVTGYKNIKEFIERINPAVFRVRKADVRKDLPELSIEWRFVESTKAQKKLKEHIIEQAGIFGGWTLLKEVDSNPLSLFSSGTKISIPTEHIDSENFKIEEMKELLEEIKENKVIVFSQFEKTIEMLGNTFPDSIVISGKTPPSERLKIVGDWLVGNKQFLISTEIFAYGLDLPNGVDFMINFDLPENPARLYQRANRIHRITSKNGKKVFNLVGGGIERDIYEILKEKQLLHERVVEENEIKKVDVKKLITEKYGMVV